MKLSPPVQTRPGSLNRTGPPQALAEALLESGAPGLYFFTLNLERSVAEIVARLPALARGEPPPIHSLTIRSYC